MSCRCAVTFAKGPVLFLCFYIFSFSTSPASLVRAWVYKQVAHKGAGSLIASKRSASPFAAAKCPHENVYPSKPPYFQGCDVCPESAAAKKEIVVPPISVATRQREHCEPKTVPMRAPQESVNMDLLAADWPESDLPAPVEECFFFRGAEGHSASLPLSSPDFLPRRPPSQDCRLLRVPTGALPPFVLIPALFPPRSRGFPLAQLLVPLITRCF